jgi:hypothetical protein
MKAESTPRHRTHESALHETTTRDVRSLVAIEAKQTSGKPPISVAIDPNRTLVQIRDKKVRG